MADNTNRKNTFVPGLHLAFAPLRFFEELPPLRFPLEDLERLEDFCLRDLPREGVLSFDFDLLLEGVDSDCERSRVGPAPWMRSKASSSNSVCDFGAERRRLELDDRFRWLEVRLLPEEDFLELDLGDFEDMY